MLPIKKTQDSFLTKLIFPFIHNYVIIKIKKEIKISFNKIRLLLRNLSHNVNQPVHYSISYKKYSLQRIGSQRKTFHFSKHLVPKNAKYSPSCIYSNNKFQLCFNVLSTMLSRCTERRRNTRNFLINA